MKLIPLNSHSSGLNLGLESGVIWVHDVHSLEINELHSAKILLKPMLVIGEDECKSPAEKRLNVFHFKHLYEHRRQIPPGWAGFTIYFLGSSFTRPEDRNRSFVMEMTLGDSGIVVSSGYHLLGERIYSTTCMSAIVID
jgi:hypothetical protein